MNLIDEEDIIIEEDSKEAISKSNTLSEIQLKKQQESNTLSGTGSDIQRLVKLIK